MRPNTLAEVAVLTAAGDSFHRCLANFLDEFYAGPRAEGLEPKPRLLEPTLGESGRLQDAYLAATAEELARIYKFAGARVDASRGPMPASPVVCFAVGGVAGSFDFGEPARVPRTKPVRQQKRFVTRIMKKRARPDEAAKAKLWARRLSARVNKVLAAHPDADRDNVRHTLILLELPPLERLQRSLIRGRSALAATQSLKRRAKKK